MRVIVLYILLHGLLKYTTWIEENYETLNILLEHLHETSDIDTTVSIHALDLRYRRKPMITITWH